MDKKYIAGKKIIVALLFALFSIGLMYGVSVIFKTATFISDTGGLSTFASMFGTLYGIVVAFVIFEVWSQFNRTSGLVDKEASGLERLFRLTLYINDNKLAAKMKTVIKNYANLVSKEQFQKLACGLRDTKSGHAFREIVKVIKEIKFGDEKDPIVFQDIVEHYCHLSETRTERINQSLARLPYLLKVFLYASSFLTLVIFIFMPFANIFYGFLTTGTLAFIIAMVFQLINDLDNPFDGFWIITPEPFDRAIKHIEEDY